jgi:hypothetical protein
MSEQSKKYSTQVVTKVCIPWQIAGTISYWNDTCARAIELFGLPGDRYSCKFSKECIEFHFNDEQDAIRFELCCG